MGDADKSDIQFALQWPRCALLTSLKVFHLPSWGPKSANWKGRTTGPFSTVEEDDWNWLDTPRADRRCFAERLGRIAIQFNNGNQAEEGLCDHGVSTGLWTEWFEAGTIEAQGYYVDGRPNGLWTRYSIAGRKIMECNFDSGYLHGELRFWNHDGARRLSD